MEGLLKINLYVVHMKILRSNDEIKNIFKLKDNATKRIMNTNFFIILKINKWDNFWADSLGHFQM